MIHPDPLASTSQLLAANLQELIQLKHIALIQIYGPDSDKTSSESGSWFFDAGLIQVGSYWYSLNRILKYECRNTTLSLHFLST